MSIRVAGGYLKGRLLKTLPGTATRPTTSRVREAIFSILQHDIIASDVLDIFAGSGALAIEAISRGAASAIMIEENPRAAATIRDNLRACDLNPRLITADYRAALKTVAREGKVFHIVVADPPYGLIEPRELFLLLTKYSLMNDNGLFIMEHAGNLAPKAENVILTRRFGDSAITIIKYERQT